MKAIVTGGAGFIGSHLVGALLDDGFEVHIIDNYAAGKKEERFDTRAVYHDVDITNYDDIVPIIAGAEYVFHEAALPRVQFSIEHPLETFAVNVTGTQNILHAAQ